MHLDCPRNRCELFPSPKFLPPTQNLIETLITHDYIHSEQKYEKRDILTVQLPASLRKYTLCISPHSLSLGEVSQGEMSATQQQKFHTGRFRVQTSARPTLRVLLRRKCCLCNDICKCLDFLVFLDKDEKL